jgi:hypothetical protein
MLAKSVLSPLLIARSMRFLARREALVSAGLAGKLFCRPLTFIQQRSSQETTVALIRCVNAATTQVLGQLVIAAAEAALLAVLAVTLFAVNPLVAVAAVAFPMVSRLRVLGANGRLNIAACALGGAQLALDLAVSYAKDRKQFGKPIADFQSVQFKLADMETELQAARVMLYEAAGRLDGKTPDATRWCARAKRFVTDTAFKVANDALQIHGGYGYLADYHVERIVRDLRVHQILEGTNEIMRVIISRDILKG